MGMSFQTDPGMLSFADGMLLLVLRGEGTITSGDSINAFMVQRANEPDPKHDSATAGGQETALDDMAPGAIFTGARPTELPPQPSAGLGNSARNQTHRGATPPNCPANFATV